MLPLNPIVLQREGRFTGDQYNSGLTGRIESVFDRQSFTEQQQVNNKNLFAQNTTVVI